MGKKSREAIDRRPAIVSRDQGRERFGERVGRPRRHAKEVSASSSSRTAAPLDQEQKKSCVSLQEHLRVSGCVELLLGAASTCGNPGYQRQPAIGGVTKHSSTSIDAHEWVPEISSVVLAARAASMSQHAVGSHGKMQVQAVKHPNSDHHSLRMHTRTLSTDAICPEPGEQVEKTKAKLKPKPRNWRACPDTEEAQAFALNPETLTEGFRVRGLRALQAASSI